MRYVCTMPLAIIINIITTRPMPAYGRQGLAGEILGPECSSSGYILGAQLGLDILTGGPH